MTAKPPEVGPFVAGLCVGFFSGAIAVFFLFLLITAGIGLVLHDHEVYGFVAIYVLGAGLGIWAVRLLLSRIDLVSGLVTGGAAGFLGLGAACNVLVGGLGNMH
ncbi:MAG TPA: hypothetical protein VKR05_05025 [Candidatus Cybelea sp.]|nr:hypothetical protein [Candidatus Cybelea sp.]